MGRSCKRTGHRPRYRASPLPDNYCQNMRGTGQRARVKGFRTGQHRMRLKAHCVAFCTLVDGSSRIGHWMASARSPAQFMSSRVMWAPTGVSDDG
jgi:hypothetical protein